VVLTACYPQDRIAFFGLLALWGGTCAFVATVLRNFASYAAALAGYTAVIVGADTLGATGGASSDVFLLAVYRASEICIGIVCAGIVLAGTDLGGAKRRLATLLADLAADIAGGFTRMLAGAGPRPATQAERHELVRRVIEIDPIIDQVLGESSHLRDRWTTLQTAVDGPLAALAGWRGVATHLERLPDDMGHQAMEFILYSIPPQLRSAWEISSPKRWMAEPTRLQRACEEGERTLLTQTTDTPSRRLLADETAKVLSGIASMLDALSLLVDGPGRAHAGNRQVPPGVADWLPALVNGARVFVAIGGIELFWAQPGRTVPRRWCWSPSCSCCCHQKAIWPTKAPLHSRLPPPLASWSRRSSNLPLCQRSKRSPPSAPPSDLSWYPSALPQPGAGRLL
jgi:hypothetical protein